MTAADRPVPRVSVVVPVYNRSEELGRLLDALARQSFPRDRFEVVVADDGSAEDLAPVVARAAASGGLTAVYVRQENRGPGPARQLGLAYARGEVVVNTDSDCVPGPGWVAAWSDAFDDPEVGLAGGPIDFLGARHLSGRCVGFLMASKLGGGGGTDPRRSLGLEYHPCAGNLAARRAPLLDVGGFPEIGYNEDTELSQRFRSRGVRPRFVPAAAVLHDETCGLPRLVAENYLKGSCRVRGPGLGGLVAALPAGLVLNLAALPAAPLLGPASALVLAPLAVYAAALVALSAQGGFVLRSPRAAAAIPFYALAMHVGYGAGYLAARLGRPPAPADPQPAATDWAAVRARASAYRAFGPAAPGVGAEESRATAPEPP